MQRQMGRGSQKGDDVHKKMTGRIEEMRVHSTQGVQGRAVERGVHEYIQRNAKHGRTSVVLGGKGKEKEKRVRRE